MINTFLNRIFRISNLKFSINTKPYKAMNIAQYVNYSIKQNNPVTNLNDWKMVKKKNKKKEYPCKIIQNKQ